MGYQKLLSVSKVTIIYDAAGSINLPLAHDWNNLFLGYSKGGEAYWASGLHLYAPLPFVRNELVRRIRIHSFATAGNLIQCGEWVRNWGRHVLLPTTLLCVLVYLSVLLAVCAQAG